MRINEPPLKSGLFFIKKSLVIPYVYWAFLCFKERDIVNVIKKKFPKSLENKILQNVKKRHLDIHFIDGAFIEIEDTNIKFIEPYKVIFKSKSSEPTKYLVALIFDKELGSKQTIFINEIGEVNKCSITKLFQLVNNNIC